MWLCTTHGFYSAVCARTEPSHSAPVDPDRIMIRARVKQHLENLKKRFATELAEHDIVETDADYSFRIFVPKTTWVAIASQLAEETDYDNFKSAVRTRMADAAYTSALIKTWSTFHALQK